MEHLKYMVLVAPSSNNENEFTLATTFDECEEILNKMRESDEGTDGADIYSFETKAERLAFMAGYDLAIGHMGNGFRVCKNLEENYSFIPTDKWLMAFQDVWDNQTGCHIEDDELVTINQVKLDKILKAFCKERNLPTDLCIEELFAKNEEEYLW